MLPKPADSIDWLNLRPWLNWIEHWVADPKVAGSSPAGRIRISLDFIVTHLKLKVGGMEPGDVARAQELWYNGFVKQVHPPIRRVAITQRGGACVLSSSI